MPKSTLAAGLRAAAKGKTQTASDSASRVKADKTVLIGAHYPPEVRRALFLLQAEPENDGKTLKQLLGEAINDLCAKYRKPQPYNGEP